MSARRGVLWWLALGLSTCSYLGGCGGAGSEAEPNDAGDGMVSTDGADGCVEGRVAECPCPGDTTGRQECLSGGTWGDCRCGADAGASDTGSTSDASSGDGETGTNGPCPPTNDQFAVPEEAVDITEHGAEPNPDDPSLEAATENTKAIWKAAEEAGKGGAIYVPSGRYYIGLEERGTNVAFGGQEPAGISIYGDGPNESILALTEHLDPDGQSHVMFKYREGANHGTVKYAHIQFDGNADNVGKLHGGSKTRAGRLYHLNDVDTMQFYNAYVYNWYSTALRNNSAQVEIAWSTFEDIGITAKNDGGSGHAVELHGGATIEHSNFRRVGSFAVNIRYGDGTVVVRDSYMKGMGTGALKYSAGERFEAHNTYIQPNTSWLENNIEGGDDAFHGWNFVNQIVDRNDTRKTLKFVDCELRDTVQSGFKIREKMRWESERTAMHNANIREEFGNGAVSVEGEDADLVADVKSVSIHDSEGDAIHVRGDAIGGEGTIETLKRGGNSGGLGQLDDISVEDDQSGADPYDPDVPAESEVGIECEAPRN